MIVTGGSWRTALVVARPVTAAVGTAVRHRPPFVAGDVAIGIGGADEHNKWFWVSDEYAGYEKWELSLLIAEDIPEDGQFEYAIVYRHGVVNDAETYEFWDNNNGNNYVVAVPKVTE